MDFVVVFQRGSDGFLLLFFKSWCTIILNGGQNTDFEYRYFCLGSVRGCYCMALPVADQKGETDPSKFCDIEDVDAFGHMLLLANKVFKKEEEKECYLIKQRNTIYTFLIK